MSLENPSNTPFFATEALPQATLQVSEIGLDPNDTNQFMNDHQIYPMAIYAHQKMLKNTTRFLNLIH